MSMQFGHGTGVMVLIVSAKRWINTWTYRDSCVRLYRWKQFWQCDFAKVSNRDAQWAFSHKIFSPALIGRPALANLPSFSLQSNTSALLNLSLTSNGSAVCPAVDASDLIFLSVSIWRVNILIMICASLSSFPRFSIGRFDRSRWVTVSLRN